MQQDPLLHTNGSVQVQAPAATSPGCCRAVLFDSSMQSLVPPGGDGMALG